MVRGRYSMVLSPMPVLKVALTGGIATGKSHVLANLGARGVPTIDADDVVHDALGAGSLTTKAIAAQFGDAVLRSDGSVDRKLLGSKVFADDQSRRKAESIIHPVVYATIQKWFATLNKPIGVASIPLLYETGREGDFDVVVATVCPPEQQLQRIVARDGISEEQAAQRIAAQLPSEEKANRADFVIRTDGDVTSTDRQVDELMIVLERRNEGG